MKNRLKLYYFNGYSQYFSMNMLITNKDYKIHGLDLHFLFFKTNKFTQSLQLYNKGNIKSCKYSECNNPIRVTEYSYSLALIPSSYGTIDSGTPNLSVNKQTMSRLKRCHLFILLISNENYVIVCNKFISRSIYPKFFIHSLTLYASII